MLYTTKDINLFRDMRSDKGWEELTAVVADTLSHADLKIPSLEQIRVVESEIS